MLTLLVTLCAIGADPTITIEAGRFRIVDGDTIAAVIDHKSEKIRIVGIDTPESVDPRKPVETKDGFAHAYGKYPHPRMREYAKAERKAREAKRGLWADSVRPVEPVGAAKP